MKSSKRKNPENVSSDENLDISDESGENLFESNEDVEELLKDLTVEISSESNVFSLGTREEIAPDSEITQGSENSVVKDKNRENLETVQQDSDLNLKKLEVCDANIESSTVISSSLNEREKEYSNINYNERECSNNTEFQTLSAIENEFINTEIKSDDSNINSPVVTISEEKKHSSILKNISNLNCVETRNSRNKPDPDSLIKKENFQNKTLRKRQFTNPFKSVAEQSGVISKKSERRALMPVVNSPENKISTGRKRCRVASNAKEDCVIVENEDEPENNGIIVASPRMIKDDSLEKNENDSGETSEPILKPENMDDGGGEETDKVYFSLNAASYLDDVPFPLLCKNVITDDSEPTSHTDYKKAFVMNRRRYLSQLRNGDLENCQTIEDRKRELASKSVEQKIREAQQIDRRDRAYAYNIARISLRVSQALADRAPNQGVIAKYLLRFLYLPVTPGSLIYVPNFIHIVSFCRGCKRFIRFVRSLANRCYSICHAMFPIPHGCNFETVFMSEVRKFAPRYVIEHSEDMELFDYGDLSERSEGSEYEEVF